MAFVSLRASAGAQLGGSYLELPGGAGLSARASQRCATLVCLLSLYYAIARSEDQVLYQVFTSRVPLEAAETHPPRRGPCPAGRAPPQPPGPRAPAPPSGPFPGVGPMAPHPPWVGLASGP